MARPQDSTRTRLSAGKRVAAAALLEPVTEWSRPAPIYEYQLQGTTGAVLHVERKIVDRPGVVQAVGRWIEEYALELEECVYSPCPGSVADIEVVASGKKADVLKALKAVSGPRSILDVLDPDRRVPETRHTARCTLYVPDDILTENVLVPVGEAAFQPDVTEYPGLPYANISHLVVERSPYALGVPGYSADVFLTADSREVLCGVLAKIEHIRDPLGSGDSWIFRAWPCACPACAGITQR